MKKTRTTVTTALRSALAASVVLAPLAAGAADNPFGTELLKHGYQLAADTKTAEGKCGEAKCGSDKKTAPAEDKKTEGRCGSDKKQDGRCGSDKQ